jgi:hypothetical protein
MRDQNAAQFVSTFSVCTFDCTSTLALVAPVIEDCDSVKTSFSDDENRFSRTEFESDAEHNLFCCILMLDILLKQMELQDIDKHTGLNSSLCKDVCWLLKCMITAAWIGNHSCSTKSECSYCESSIMWHQLSLQLVKYLSPIYPAHPPDVSSPTTSRFPPLICPCSRPSRRTGTITAGKAHQRAIRKNQNLM